MHIKITEDCKQYFPCYRFENPVFLLDRELVCLFLGFKNNVFLNVLRKNLNSCKRVIRSGLIIQPCHMRHALNVIFSAVSVTVFVSG